VPSNSNIRTNDATKVPSLSKVPASVSPELRRYLETLEQVTNIRLGRRGDPRDRAITLRELISSGLAQELAASPYNPNSSSGGTGFVPAGTKLINAAVPPAPTGFSVNGAYSVINMSWNLATYGNHAHTEIHTHTSDVIGDAVLLGISASRVFSDPVGSGQTRYYWIRHVNTEGVRGPWNAAAGTVGQTAADVQHLLTVLSNSITSSELATSLSTRVDLIDAAATVTNSVAYRVAQEASARATAIAAEASARVTALAAIVTGIPVYDSTEAYAVDQVVRISNSNSKLYICIQAVSANSSVAITDTAYWKIYGDYDSLKSSTDASSAAITQINTVNSTSTSAAALAITGLNASVYVNGDPSQGLILATSSALSAVQTEVFPNGTANASRLDTLDAEVFDASGNSLLATASALGTVTTEVFPTGTANASRLDTLDAEVFASDGSSLLATASALNTVQTEVFPTGTANASRLDTLDAEVFDANGSRLATAAALSTVTAEVFPNGTASASRLDTLDATVYDANGAVQLATASALSTIQAEVFPDGTSSASRLDALDNILFDPSTTPPTARVSASNLTTMKNQILNTNGTATATATQMTQLAASFTDPQGSTNTLSLQQALETSASEVDGLRGQYSVKIDNNGHVSGFGFNSTAVDGTPRSAFIVRADTFAIVDPTSTGNGLGTTTPSPDSVPFIYHDGTGLLNGETVPAGVYMKNAFIGDAQITSAKVKNLGVDKITGTFADFQSVLTGNLDANRINLDNTTLTSVNVDNGDGTSTPTLSVGAIAANKITSGEIDAGVITVTNLDADEITGDVNVFQSINASSTVTLSNANQWYEILDATLQAPAISHLPIASLVMQATKSSSNGTQVDMKITMQLPSGPAAATLGAVASRSITVVGSGGGYQTVYIANITGNVTSSVATGNTIYNSSSTSQTGTVVGVSFSGGVTSIQYTGSTYFTVGTTLVRAAMSASETTVFEGGQDHNFSNGQISQAAAGSFTSGVTSSIRVRAYAKKHGKTVVVTKVNGFIGGIR